MCTSSFPLLLSLPISYELFLSSLPLILISLHPSLSSCHDPFLILPALLTYTSHTRLLLLLSHHSPLPSFFLISSPPPSSSQYLSRPRALSWSLPACSHSPPSSPHALALLALLTHLNLRCLFRTHPPEKAVSSIHTYMSSWKCV